MDGGVAIKMWKTNSSGQDLLLEGGKPVEIKPEKDKIKKEEHVADNNCYNPLREKKSKEGMEQHLDR